MKRLKLLSIVAPVLAFFGTLGCNHATIRPPARSYATSSNSAYAPRATTYALAVSVNGGLPPTPGQWAALQAKFARDLAAAGQILVTDLTLADQIIRVDFFPNEDNPEDTGRAVIVSIRPNNLRGTSSASSLAYAYRGGRYPTSFGFGGAFLDSFHAFGNSYSSFYGYGNSYYDGFSYATPTLNPQRPAPPAPVIPTHPGHRHHRPGEPRDPVKCPPLLAAVAPEIANRTAYPPSDRASTTLTGGIGRLVGERTYAYADRSERNYARGAPSSASAAQPDHSSTWFSRLFSSSDSRSSGSNSNRTTSEQTAASAERTYQRSDRTNYSRSESGYSKNDSSYSRSESSYSAPSYSPPPQSYSPPAYSPPPASYSAPSYSPPPAPATSTAETSTSKN